MSDLDGDARAELATESGLVIDLVASSTAPASDEFELKLEIRASRTFDAANERFQADLARWEHAPQGAPPTEPAEAILSLPMILRDSEGRDYTFSRGFAGGTGTERRGSLFFRPNPPATAKRLEVAVGGRVAAVLVRRDNDWEIQR